jgi:hypothetical protein
MEVSGIGGIAVIAVIAEIAEIGRARSTAAKFSEAAFTMQVLNDFKKKFL